MGNVQDKGDTPSYFVFFNSQAAAATAAQCELFPEGSEQQFRVHRAPGPEEVRQLWTSFMSMVFSMPCQGCRYMHTGRETSGKRTTLNLMRFRERGREGERETQRERHKDRERDRQKDKERVKREEGEEQAMTLSSTGQYDQFLMALPSASHHHPQVEGTSTASRVLSRV
jgi:hypothetical protein